MSQTFLHRTCNTLSQLQVRALEVHGNWSSDWSLVRVSTGSKTGVADGRVRGCSFHGPVQLGDLSGEVHRGTLARFFACVQCG